MRVECVLPPNLPPEACPHIRQEKHPVEGVEPGYVLTAVYCMEHDLGLGEDAEKCKHRGNAPCWYRLGQRGPA